jgi:hypothetical protein
MKLKKPAFPPHGKMGADAAHHDISLQKLVLISMNA